MTINANARPNKPPPAASIPVVLWNTRATWASAPPSRWTISIVSRLVPSAERTASSTADASASASRATSAIASHCSSSIASSTGFSQRDWASTRAAGATLPARARSLVRRASVSAPTIRARRSAQAPG